MRLPARLLEALRIYSIVRRLQRRNARSEESIVSVVGPVVSLTSYGRRIDTVFLTIESIASGSFLPSRIILWLDHEPTFQNLPDSLIRLKRRGLEVCLTVNYGPHTKYYPYIKVTRLFEVPLVTADDDILYPHDWLKRLAEAHSEEPAVINCYRARVIAFEGEALAGYEHWELCRETTPKTRHFATGVSGVIYPPMFLDVLRDAGTAFTDCCPRADDIWLHVQALRAGYKVRQFVSKATHFPILPNTQQMALQHSNWGSQGGNDSQAAATYKREDLKALHRSE